MAKLVKCKTCGEEIAKSAKVCPKCGAKQKKSNPVVTVFACLLLVVVIFSVLSGGNDDPELVESTQSPNVSASATPVPKKTEFYPGETAALNDVEVTFVSCEESSGKQFFAPEEGNIFVLCKFLIDNKSTSDIAVSSLLSFEAYVDDFSTTMSLTATTLADDPQLDGSVAAGKKMSGVIGYEVPKDWEKLEVNFTPSFWSGKDIKFVATKAP